MRVRAVPRNALRDIRTADWVDRSRSPYAEGAIAWVPVKSDEPCDRELPERSCYRGRGFSMIGTIAVVRGRKPSQAETEEIVRFRRPRGVLWIESLEDVTRTPKTELLWGESGEVSHKENGYTYILDPAKVMFAQGNRAEKMRLWHLIRESGTAERVADMFAGIGYFSIPMAGAGARVHAMEINPVAYYYLNRTVAENRFSDRIEAVQGDCRTHLSGVYDRIVMGHFAAIAMLSPALRHVKAGTVIHLHSIGAVEEQIRQQVEGAGFSATIHVHTVKKYRPHAWHVVQDVVIA